MLDAYFLDVTKLSDDALFCSCYLTLPKYRREKTDRYAFRKDKNLSVGVGILLQRGLEKYGLGKAEICVSEDGKPYIPGNPVYFSLSHSENMAFAVFSDVPVGCDIEKIGKGNLGIAERFFTESENEAINNSCDSNLAFYRIWTVKESYLKGLGGGLKKPLSSFEVVSDGAGSYIKDEPFWQIAELNCIKGYAAAVAFYAGSKKEINIINSEI